MSNTIGLKIKTIRETLHLSQAKFCELLDIGLSGYKKYEAGISEPGAGNLEKIANHPNPGAEILQEIKKDLAADMPKFKMHDAKVHNAATSIVKLAGQHDLVGIFAEYHKLIDGCQSCHSDFRGRISVVLGKK